MKKRIIIGLLVLIAGAFIYWTFFKKEPFEGNYAKFNFIQDDLAMHVGETIDLKIDVLYDEVTELQLVFDDEVLETWKSPEKQVKHTFKADKDELMGTHTLVVVAVSEEGTTRDERMFQILSDIKPQIAKAEIVESFVHDSTSYTQGLEFYNGKLYEGTGDPGQQGKTMVGEVDRATGKFIEGKRCSLDATHFGEGITILNDTLYQLTWLNGKCFMYDVNDFTKATIGEFTYAGEGWGLCNDGKSLIMSDGSERITFRNPKTFAVERVIEVYNNERPIPRLNELEYINGLIYANVYTTNFIVVIDPKTGKVQQQINAEKLANLSRGDGDVLNGIAYNPETQKMIVTGKYWKKYLEVKVTPVQ